MNKLSRETQDILREATRGGHLPQWLHGAGAWMEAQGIGYGTMLPIGTPVAGPAGCGPSRCPTGIGAATAHQIAGIGCRRVRLQRR